MVRRSTHSTLKVISPEYSSKDWCWSWSANPLASWCKELIHLKGPWCWGRLNAGGEGDDRGRDCWMVSLTQWTRVCVNSGSWWWTGRTGMLQSMGSQGVGHDWETELNWTDSFTWTVKELSHNTHLSILPQTLLLSRLPHDTEQSSLCCKIGPYWLSI